MDGHRFDVLAKAVATGRSRRTVLRGLGAGALGLLGASRMAQAAPAGKVTICHWDADLGVFQQLTISQNGLHGHRNHLKDNLTPDFANDSSNCGGCGVVCTGDATCSNGECVSVPKVCTPANMLGADGLGRICQNDGDCPCGVCGGPDQNTFPLRCGCSGSGFSQVEPCCSGAADRNNICLPGPAGMICVNGDQCLSDSCVSGVCA